MHFVIIMSLIIMFVVHGATSDVKSRIFGGQACPKYVHTYVVFIEIGPYRCSGTLLGPIHVLTAGHCCTYNVSTKIYALYKPSKGRGSQESGVAKKIIHPMYEPTNFFMDVCIMVLATPLEIKWELDIEAVCLANATLFKDLIIPGKEVEIAGFGANAKNIHDDFFVDNSKLMQCATVTVEKASECLDYLKDEDREMYREEAMLCLKSVQLGHLGPCIGDSGGPVMKEGVQIGILSWGPDTCDLNTTIAANINPAVDFIREHTGNAPFNCTSAGLSLLNYLNLICFMRSMYILYIYTLL